MIVSCGSLLQNKGKKIRIKQLKKNIILEIHMALFNHFNFLIFYIFVVFTSDAHKNHTTTDLFRKKRYLLFPNPLDSETKVQVLFGLGLPMEEEISMTIGYVLKCNYILPYNVTDFTQPYVRYQRDVEKANEIDQYNDETSRWDLYRILELALNRLGSGKACLLRAVCEAAQNPFDQRHGLLGELLHIFLKPSTTQEPYRLNEDREYHAAELIGRLSIDRCRSAFPECIKSPLEYFSYF